MRDRLISPLKPSGVVKYIITLVKHGLKSRVFVRVHLRIAQIAGLTPDRLSGSMHYDAAGNLDVDTYSAAAFSRVYDAENRMTQETRTTTDVTGTYSYDGDGRRVKRVVGNTETWQVYGVGGELISEYAANTAAYNPQKEYGYRNGQLLITADAPVTGSGGWGAPPAFTGPDRLAKGDDIKLENLTELLTAVNSLRAHAGLPTYNFTVDSSPERNETTVKRNAARGRKIS